MKEAQEPAGEVLSVQRLGERIIISCRDETTLNGTIERLSRDTRVVSIASWREASGITAIVTLADRNERTARLATVPTSRVA